MTVERTKDTRILGHLQGYQGTRAEIIRLVEELGALKLEHDSVKGSMPVHPYCPMTFSITGLNIRVVARLQRRVQRLRARQQVVEQYVASIPDPVVRCIVRLRYLDGFSWKTVAKKIGGSNTSDSVRKAANRYFSRLSG